MDHEFEIIRYKIGVEKSLFEIRCSCGFSGVYPEIDDAKFWAYEHARLLKMRRGRMIRRIRELQNSRSREVPVGWKPWDGEPTVKNDGHPTLGGSSGLWGHEDSMFFSLFFATPCIPEPHKKHGESLTAPRE